jgi:hypothetical protein
MISAPTLALNSASAEKFHCQKRTPSSAPAWGPPWGSKVVASSSGLFGRTAGVSSGDGGCRLANLTQCALTNKAPNSFNTAIPRGAQPCLRRVPTSDGAMNSKAASAPRA